MLAAAGSRGAKSRMHSGLPGVEEVDLETDSPSRTTSFDPDEIELAADESSANPGRD